MHNVLNFKKKKLLCKCNLTLFFFLFFWWVIHFIHSSGILDLFSLILFALIDVYLRFKTPFLTFVKLKIYLTNITLLLNSHFKEYISFFFFIKKKTFQFLCFIICNKYKEISVTFRLASINDI